MKAFAVIGYHHTGKTTVVTELIKSITAKGYKVATIKDIHAEAYHADDEGSNTHKHMQAGAAMVFAKGLTDSSLIFPTSLTLKEIIPLLHCDYLIIEGMREAAVPKVLCAENTEQLEELYDDTVMAISGKIASEVKNWQEPPVFEINNDCDKLTALILDKTFDILPLSDSACCSHCGLTCYEMVAAILREEHTRSDCLTDNPNDITVTVDGKNITMVPFVQNVLRDLIKAFMQNLKGADPNGNIKIEVNHHDNS
jgi:molybdopterin-guanine dinucleotide biosynthesis protein B